MLMDSGQIPQVQPVAPAQPSQAGASVMPMVQQVQAEPEKKKDVAGLVKTIAIVVVSLVAVTFIGLFIWMFMQYNEVQEDVNGQINDAVAKAKEEQAIEKEKEFAEREKDPYQTFSGPADYGQLTFEYPKTWSVYIANSATNGGDFYALLNPGQVDADDGSTIYALTVSIRNISFEDVAAEYQGSVGNPDANLTLELITIGSSEGNDGATANLYTGTIPGTEFNGYIAIFKIRDKTAILKTNSVFFKEDFDRILSTIEFNA